MKKGKFFNASQKFSRAIVQPVMFMAVTGLLVAIGIILSIVPGISGIGTYFYQLMLNGGINQLSVIFCVGITVALARHKKTDAAILGISVFLLYLYAQNAWMAGHGMLTKAESLTGTGQAMVLGVQVVDMGVFLGIFLGCLTAFVFNKLCDVEFTDVLRIYGGSRFAYLVMIPVTAALAIAFSYFWPVVNSAISAMTLFIDKAGAFGVFLYGFLNRILIPTGLHHLVYMPFMYTNLGGTLEVAGQVYNGSANIMIAQMTDAASLTALDDSIKWAMFGFAKIFGSLGIALAFVKTARPENRRRVKGLVIPTAVVAMVSGITEPLEFLFLFISPVLWLLHSLLDGFFQMVVYLLGGRLAISGGLLSALPVMLTVPMSLTKAYVTFGVGAAGAFVWYFAFKFLIVKLNLKTPGREAADEAAPSEAVPAQGKNKNAQGVTALGNIMDIVNGLGGADNIVSVNNCFTRLRVEVKDAAKVNEDLIKKFKVAGIIRKGNGIQIIIGMKVQTVREGICDLLHME